MIKDSFVVSVDIAVVKRNETNQKERSSIAIIWELVVGEGTLEATMDWRRIFKLSLSLSFYVVGKRKKESSAAAAISSYRWDFGYRFYALSLRVYFTIFWFLLLSFKKYHFFFLF